MVLGAGAMAAVSALALLASQPAQAMTILFPWTECKEPTVSVTMKIPTANVRSRLSSEQLTQMDLSNAASGASGVNGHNASMHGRAMGKTMGLYGAQMVMDMQSATISANGLGSARLCVIKTDVSIDLVHAIDLARELVGQDCEMSEALKHERMHEKIQVKALLAEKTYVEQAIKKRLREFKGKTMASARLDLDEAQDVLLKEMGNTLSMRAQEQQKLLDTPAEYQRIANACPSRQ